MQPENKNHKNFDNDSKWHLLSEFSFTDVMLTEGLEGALLSGSLYQALRELSMPPESQKMIEKTIVETVSGVIDMLSDERADTPVHVRLFCRNRLVGEMLRTNTLLQTEADRSTPPAENPPNLDTKVLGGWGYFLINRGRGFENVSFGDSPMVIELYIYKEGE